MFVYRRLMKHKRQYKQRNIWSPQSEEYLTELWSEKIDWQGSRHRQQIYEVMMEELQRKGFAVTAVEIRTKINNLRAKYKSERAKLRSSRGSASDWPLYNKVHQILCGFKINNVQTLAENILQDEAQLDCGNSDEFLIYDRTCNSNYNEDEDLHSDTTSCVPLKKVIKTEIQENNLSADDHDFSSIDNDTVDQYHNTHTIPIRQSSTDGNASGYCSHETDPTIKSAKAAKLRAETRYFNEMADLARAKRELIELQKKRLHLELEDIKMKL